MGNYFISQGLFCLTNTGAGLCPTRIKEMFGLKRHLKRNTNINGYLSVKFTPIRKKK